MMNRLGRVCLPTLLLLAGACATGAQNGVGANNQTTNTVIISNDGYATTVNGSAAVGTTLHTDMAVDSALARLETAYRFAGVPVTVLDRATGRIGNSHLSLRHTLNNEALSRFIDCGRSMTASHADQDQIMLSVVSTFRAAPGGGTNVETLLTATAFDRTSGNATDGLPCSTRGLLETRIHRNAFQTP